MHKDGTMGQRKTQLRRWGLREPVLQGDQRLAKLLRELAVRREIDAMLPQDLFVDERLQQIVNVVAAEMGIAVSGEHLIDIAFGGGNELEDGDVERAAAEVVDRHAAALLFVQPVGQCGRRGLIDQTQHVETGDLAGVLGGLALRIVEVRGHGDDGAVDGFPEESFSPVLQFAENKGGNLRRRERLVSELHPDHVVARLVYAEWKQLQLTLDVCHAAAHQPLDGIDGALGLREQTTQCRLADDDAAVGINADNGRAERASTRPGDTLGRIRLRTDGCDEAVGGAKIDSDDASHVCLALSRKKPRLEAAATAIPFERLRPNYEYTSGG